MAISHICQRCGDDLARRRAAVDAALRAPVVVCPGCGWACVRRRHPIVAGWRRAARVSRAAGVMILQTLAALALLAMVVSNSAVLTEVMIESGSGLVVVLVEAFRIAPGSGGGVWGRDDFAPFRVAMWLFGSAGAGVWVASCFPHWRPAARPAVWAALLLLCISASAIWWIVQQPFAALLGREMEYLGPTMKEWLLTAQTLGASMVLTMASLTLGGPTRRMWRVAAGARRRRMLRNRRKQRSAQ